MSLKNKKQKLFISLIILLLAAVVLTFVLWHRGIFIPNASNVKKYSVKGVDVSAYQGEISWPKIQEQNIRFAFIKATEGSTFVDKQFSDNWKNAKSTNLRIGAYHFFSYDSEGKRQAENYIKNVPIDEQALPPVIDVEFYGDKEKNPPNRMEVEKELKEMVKMLEDHYGKRVILYTTQKAYNLYIQGSYDQCDIWIRDVFTKPSLSDKRAWTFWQYTDRGLLEGYNGSEKEKFIDLNVFYGSENEFLKYGD